MEPREPYNSKAVVAILLVDPPIVEGCSIWSGYINVVPSPSVNDDFSRIPRTSVLEQIIYWLQQMSLEEVRPISQDPRILFRKPLCIVCSEWILLLHYANARFSRLEWEVEDPDLRHKDEVLTLTLDKLHTWRRRFPMYKYIISEALDNIVRRDNFLNFEENPLRAFQRDFEILLAQMDDLHNRAERMISVVTAVLSIEESQKALQQNRSLGRFTYLAALFVPLSFVSSFFGMNDDKLKKND